MDSGIANKAIAKIVKSMPSCRKLKPNVCLGKPVWKSRPIIPIDNPINIAMSDLIRDPVVMVVDNRSAITMSKKYSLAPNTVATFTKTGDKNVKPTMASVPAKNEPSAADARAALARPFFAIS